MNGYTEEDLKAFHKLTEEVYIISEKPQLAIVQKMKQIPCNILSTGIQWIIFFVKHAIKSINFQYAKSVPKNVTEIILY